MRMLGDGERDAVGWYRRLRVAIFACCAVEFAVVFAILRWKYPLEWDRPTWSDLAEILTAFAAMSGPAIAGWFTVLRLQRQRPARLRVTVVRRRPAFTIPAAASARYWALVSASAGAAFAAAAVIHAWRTGLRYEVGAPVGAALAIWFATRPYGLVLYPDRLTERAWRPKLSVAWSALAPDGPALPLAGASTLDLPVGQPVPPKSPARVTIPLHALDVDPAFLVAVIRHVTG
jgi:hypothetical protein